MELMGTPKHEEMFHAADEEKGELEAENMDLDSKVEKNEELNKLRSDIKNLALELVTARDAYVNEDDESDRIMKKEAVYTKHQALEDAMDNFAFRAAKIFEDMSPRSTAEAPEYNTSKYREYIKAVQRSITSLSAHENTDYESKKVA